MTRGVARSFHQLLLMAIQGYLAHKKLRAQAEFNSSTLNPERCSLDPAPCTLHPAPCTLHPAPCTLNPEPSQADSASPGRALRTRRVLRAAPRPRCVLGAIATFVKFWPRVDARGASRTVSIVRSLYSMAPIPKPMVPAPDECCALLLAHGARPEQLTDHFPPWY